jgi:YD repeat-containing protein
MVSMTTDGVATLLAWNGEGRLSSLTQPTGAEERYAYDPAGVRRLKRAPGGSTLYVPDGVNVLLELDAETGEPIAWYTNAPGEWGGLVSQRQLANSTFHGFDLSANTRQLTGEDGDPVAEYLTDAFGWVITLVPPSRGRTT